VRNGGKDLEGQLGDGTSSYLDSISDAIRRISVASVESVLDLLLRTYVSGGRVYIMGNGGSAATATHMACDITKTAQIADRAPLWAFALTDNAALLTAWANDAAYEQVFSEQLKGLARPGDLVVAISVSGRSPNVVAGLSAAARAGARTVGLFGMNGAPAVGLVDVAIHVDSSDFGLVETVHLAIVHVLARDLRSRLAASGGRLQLDDACHMPDGGVES